MNQQLLSPGPLHRPDGALSQAGYATALVKEYDRARIAAHPLKIKEWDYYLIASDRYALALTIADNGYMGLDSVSLLDFDGPWETTQSRMSLFPMGRRGLPPSSARGVSRAAGKGYALTFENDGKSRRLYGHMEQFREGQPLLFDVTLTDAPRDSMVIATPFPGHPKAFYYNQKINCLRAAGKAVLGSGSICSRRLIPSPCWIGDGAYGRIKTPGIGARPPGWRRACPSVSTLAMALAIPPPPRKTCCSITAGRISSLRSSLKFP